MVEDDRAQALYVVEQILAHREEGTLLREQAVLMRKSSDSDVLELELIRRDIPVREVRWPQVSRGRPRQRLSRAVAVHRQSAQSSGWISHACSFYPDLGPASAERASA